MDPWNLDFGRIYLILPWWLPWTSLVAQKVKNLLATQETWIRSLGWEGNGSLLQYSCLETSMENSCPGSIPEEPGGLQSMKSQRVGHN